MKKYLEEKISQNLKKLLYIDEIKKQFTYDKREDEDALGTLDPQNEQDYNVSPRLIHRYENRAAFLTTDECFAYCRHCFRRRFSGKKHGEATKEEIKNAASYLKEHAEIKEVLLTGGDLFTLSDDDLDFLLSEFKNARPDIIYRLCTRALLTNPKRFDERLFEVIRKNNYNAPFYLLVQFNHPEEITDSVKDIVLKFLSLGIITLNQAVLLKDVNDNIETQIKLSNKLLYNRIKPYYLFQGDLVRGTHHLRVPLSKGLQLEKEMRKRLSGLAMPQYTSDLPEGGGKIILTENHIVRKENDKWVLTTLDGEEREYPED